ncbi:MAG TPA: thiamine pyrophosphate-dependent enzyme [Beijerinckiaceae bacterium]|jgi:thiamine pyrophosphate-dependent acetolactate synthase large subunit-like protein
MFLDKPEGRPDEVVAWGSDIAAQMLRRFDIPYVSLNPGASYRGLHDSLVNHLGNERPGMLLCLHEDHAVAVAHGYAKVTGKPMGCVLHSNVGLMHGMMGLYNAWCDRVPMFVLGATGPVDSVKRRPWIDWIHTTKDQGALVRSFVKWDSEPTSAQALVEAMCRANLVTRTEPTAPVYVCLDAGLQESRLETEPEWPDLARFAAPAPVPPARSAIEQAAALLAKAERPLILFGRGARTQEAWDARVRLAERLGACVMSDLKTASMFPTDHPAHVIAPFNVLPVPAREILGQADVILALDWIDLGGALRQAKRVGPVAAGIVAATLDHHLHNGFNMDYQELPPADVFMSASADEVVAALLDELGAGRKNPWRERVAPKRKETGGSITLNQVATELRGAFDDPDKVGFASLARGWPIDLWPHRDPIAYLGKDGGGGIGSGPGISVGCALALQEQGRHAVTVLGDGDFVMGANAIWTAVRHRIPLLILINNNRSYFNDELHQETVANTRGREPSNRWIGQRIADPEPDLAKLAEAQGAVGIGPVREAADVKAAIRKGVEVLKSGGVCLIDFHITPGEDRRAGSALGQRATAK